MALHRKLKNGATRHSAPTEVDQILVDLKRVLHNLSTVTVRLEKCVSLQNLNESEEEASFQSAEEDVKVNSVSVSKRVNAFQKQNHEDIKTPKLKSFHSLVEPPKPKEIKRQHSVRTEAINQTVVNHNSDKINVKDIKKRFEFNSTTSDSSSDELDETPTELNKVKVNVQSLKQKFEVENRNTATYVTNSMVEVNRRKSMDEKQRQSDNKTDEKRRKSEEKPKAGGTFVEDDRVKRMLKYFQPTVK
ncbi:hypothetical protein TcasGA2_TC006430 [Tribolium castaneum]|uniref:Uncharacterized protein n=2 Tax=Tribolium castaneum TaxID=7070 RepID=D6WWS4_TRICA|nr:hypothetical protein TcasGA2_TC006430 [Tribolium castaneum]